jgi:hypothetical protein
MISRKQLSTDTLLFLLSEARASFFSSVWGQGWQVSHVQAGCLQLPWCLLFPSHHGVSAVDLPKLVVFGCLCLTGWLLVGSHVQLMDHYVLLLVGLVSLILQTRSLLTI